jgi:hypothetical protein
LHQEWDSISRCLTGDFGSCHNVLPLTRASASPSYSASAVPSTSAPASTPSSPSPIDSDTILPPGPPPPFSPSLPDLSSIMQAYVPTLQHVPKGARDGWARVLSSCLRSVVFSPEDLSQWSRLFMLAKCVLVSPAAGHGLWWREILKRVKSCL